MKNPQPRRVLLLGGGAREHAIAAALCRNPSTLLYTIAHNQNPAIRAISHAYEERLETDTSWIADWAVKQRIDFAVIGLEDPLDAGLTDALEAHHIPTVGPTKRAAELEMSKVFTRDLMLRHNIPGRVSYYHVTTPSALERILRSGNQEFALKPIGLTAGKGVKIMGAQLNTVEEAIAYGQTVLERHIGGKSEILLEERLIGEEFTLQAFADGRTLIPMPLVQDFKRALDGDLGPNTGSMGSYSLPDGLLPFVRVADRDYARTILEQIIGALAKEGIPYRGVIYGQFMMTPNGVRLVEINARFGDPEATNVLSILETDFTTVCEAITKGTLGEIPVRFANQATVCKYITPVGYPDQPMVDQPLRLDLKRIKDLGVRPYYAKVNGTLDEVKTTSSRSIALVGVADTVGEAEQHVEEAATTCISGGFHMRHDIAKPHIIFRSQSDVSGGLKGSQFGRFPGSQAQRG